MMKNSLRRRSSVRFAHRAGARARTRFPIALLLLLAGLAGACSGGTDPEPRGVLRVSASDLDGATSTVTPAGFRIEDVTSFRIQINAGPHLVVDSTFVKVGAIQHEFELVADSYVLLMEAFQAGGVLLYTGAGEATVTPDDTAEVAVDLDPALGTVEFTIGGADSAVVATNATAPLRILIRNNRGQAVAGASIGLTVEPASAGAILFPGAAETGPDGVFLATFDPAGAETDGQIHITVDGFPIGLPPPRRFSVKSPVDVNLSTLSLTNSVRLPADGVSTVDIVVRVVDAAGVPQGGIPLVVRSSRNGPGPNDQHDLISSAQTETDAAGMFRATLRSISSSSLAGDAVITALADGKLLRASASVTYRSVVNSSATRIRVFPTSVPADGVSAAAVEATVLSQTGQPLANVFVQLKTRDDTVFIIQPRTGRTDANGVFRASTTSRVAGNTFIDVIADGLRTSATGFVTFF